MTILSFSLQNHFSPRKARNRKKIFHPFRFSIMPFFVKNLPIVIMPNERIAHTVGCQSRRNCIWNSPTEKGEDSIGLKTEGKKTFPVFPFSLQPKTRVNHDQ
jgi:hypothetical protein